MGSVERASARAGANLVGSLAFDMTNKVPNRFPLVEPPGPARIAVVGSAPDEQSAHFGAPFVGSIGELLRDNLGLVGIPWNQLFLGNVCQVRPEGNHFDRFDWNGPEVQEGIRQLREDLEKFKPTIVLCLGNEALHLFKNGNVAPPRKGRDIDWPDKIGSWRGSLFWSEFVIGGVKALAAFHPAAVLREYSLQGYYRTGLPGVGDLERLRLEAESAELVLPRRGQVIFQPGIGPLYDAQRALELLNGFCRAGQHVAIDIEGGCGNVTSIAFAQASDFAYVIPFAHVDGTSVWAEDEEIALWIAIKDLLEDPGVGKIFQHGQYDLFALAWTYGIAVRNWSDDTEEGGWELCAELRKGLATQASLYTKQQFYKPDKEDGEMVFDNDEQFWTYNGTDAAVTFEVWQRQQALMLEPQRRHYRFNMSLKPVILYMSLRGMRVDQERVREESEKAMRGAMELQVKIDQTAIATDLETDLARLHKIVETRLLPDAVEAAFARLTLRCLGSKNPRKRVEMVVERWQPMRWNGKKWVKDGKLTNGGIAAECYSSTETPPVQPGDVRVLPWLKPMPRTVSKLQPFTPACLADCEEFILGLDGESEDAKEKQRAWRRVKQIWKELKTYAHVSDKPVSDPGDGSKGGNRGAQTTNRNALQHGEKVASDSGEASTGCNHLFGELVTLLGLAVNTSSTNEGGDAQRFLFETCGLPKVWKDERTGRLSVEAKSKRKGNAEADEEVSAKPSGKRLSTDQNALDLLYAKTEDVRVLWCLQQRRLKKVVTDLAKEIDDDGRIRCSFSLVKETGRMAASESPTGTGTNMQAWNKDLRRVVVADEGCLMGQCDLEGADSWTVAAECAALGDSTMLDDLRAGLKPAKVLCLLYLLGDQINQWDRAKIKAKLREVEQPDWLYPGAKSCVHGSSYGMGIPTMIQTVLKYSMADLPLELGETKPIVMTTEQAKKLQSAFFSRYPGVKLWHEAEKRNLLNKGFVITSAGHLRRFYGRKAEWKKGVKVASHETLKEALASKPQFYTTWATKMAVWRMWNAPENRTPEGSLRVEPLTVVHDSILFQFRAEERAAVGDRVRSWFGNEVEIAGAKIVVPADGTVGQDWSMKGAEKL